MQISIQRKALLQKDKRSAANCCKSLQEHLHSIENMLTVGRNLFPSTPILKKYSAAEASLGTCYIIPNSHHELDHISK